MNSRPDDETPRIVVGVDRSGHSSHVTQRPRRRLSAHLGTLPAMTVHGPIPARASLPGLGADS